MDSLTIISELRKIENFHSSFDDSNPMTYIIFIETFKDRLSAEQIDMLENRINELTNTRESKLNEFLQTRDVHLMQTPLSEKTEEHGRLFIPEST